MLLIDNTGLVHIKSTWGDRWVINSCFLDFSIVIDSYRLHCYEHLKKINLRWKLSPWHVFECLCVRWILSCQKWQKNEVLDFSGPTCMSYGYFIQYFVCKCSFKEISMIKMVILDKSKPISLILKNRKFNIQKSKNL